MANLLYLIKVHPYIMVQTQRDDGRIDNRIENYTKFWQKDLKKEESNDNDKRLDSYTDVVNGSSLCHSPVNDPNAPFPARLL